MISYSKVNSENELEGILKLQKSNLPQSLNSEEIQSQGFVTVDHSYESLKKLNDYENHVVAKDNDKVIGYVLAMTKYSKLDIPILIPMFDLFDAIIYQGQKISGYNYLVVGQVCVAKEYRGRGIFDNCYAAYREFYKDKYDFTVTEIAKSNSRSLNAHRRIGFEEIYSFTALDKIEWIIVLWNWKKEDR